MRDIKRKETSYIGHILKPQELHIHKDHTEYLQFVLHIYAQNIHAKCRNEKTFHAKNGYLYFRKAIDSVQDDIRNLQRSLYLLNPETQKNWKKPC